MNSSADGLYEIILQMARLGLYSSFRVVQEPHDPFFKKHAIWDRRLGLVYPFEGDWAINGLEKVSPSTM